MDDPREADEQRLIAEATAEGKCPWSGLVLHMDGEGVKGSASCDMCDCFGFNPDEVKVHPRPLRLARWKVTRRTCMTCKRGFPDSTGSSICEPCFLEAIGPALAELRLSDPFAG